MERDLLWAILGIGVFQTSFAIILNVSSGNIMLGKFLFKVIPFFSGLFLIWYALKHLGL